MGMKINLKSQSHFSSAARSIEKKKSKQKVHKILKYLILTQISAFKDVKLADCNSSCVASSKWTHITA